jgi:hypothetical protein
LEDISALVGPALGERILKKLNSNED